MGASSKIEWTDHTFNPWIGCQKVSPGCQFCYAEELMDKRYGRVEWGPTGTRSRTSEANWRKPLAWNKQEWWECSSCGWRGPKNKTLFRDGSHVPQCPDCTDVSLYPTRQRVFCSSLADVFEERDELTPWRRDLFHDVIERTRNLDWLLLTKRPENVIGMIEQATGRYAEAWLSDCSHVWIGTSVEDQEAADKRIPHLLEIPAQVRFLSMEPLLGSVYLGGYMVFEGEHEKAEWMLSKYGNSQPISWVIVGGESGSNARPFDLLWPDSIKRQCVAGGIPFFMKQLGSNPVYGAGFRPAPWPISDRKGDKIEDFPQLLQTRQFPTP